MEVVFPPIPEGYSSEAVLRWRAPLWPWFALPWISLGVITAVVLLIDTGLVVALVPPWVGMAIGLVFNVRAERNYFRAGPSGVTVGGRYAVPWSRVSQIDDGVLIFDPPLTAPRSISLCGRWPRIRAASAGWRDEPLGEAVGRFAPHLLRPTA